MNTYNHFITDLYNLLPDYQDKFLGIDEVVEEIPSGYVIRPSFTFGTSYQATNLRDAEANIIVTLQIFKTHDSNIDILEVAEVIREKVYVTSLFKIDDYNYSVDNVQFQKQYESKYTSIAVQIYATKTGKNVDEVKEDALTFTSDLDGSTIKLSLMAGTVDESGLYYRFKNTGDWLKYNFDTEFTLNKGKIIQFKNTKTTFNTNLNNYAKFIMTGLFKASGNCNSLINYSNTLINSTFIYLFANCESLLTSPDLPGTDIRGSSYYRMFEGCVRLLFAPELPATTLPNQAYFHMFEGCTSLLSAPELPATTIGTNTYDSIFYNCTNLLTTPTILPAETTFSQSYQNMFYACTKIKKGPIISANKIDSRTCYGMFQGCTSLLDAPDLSATQVGVQSYQAMFQSCTSLTGVPAILPADTLYNTSYGNMFYGCTSLTKAPTLPATNLQESCYNAMFRGCTSLTTAPNLPATKLLTSCYQSMFNGCTSLTGMANMAAIDSKGATNCCNSMYAGCTSLTETYPILLSAIYTAGCYGMFNNCTSLVEAPEIMANEVTASQGVQQMFLNCSSLNKIKVHFTEWNNTGFTNWVNGVQTTSGTFICPYGLSIEHGTNRIPNNWTVLELDPVNPLTFTAVDSSTISLNKVGTTTANLKYKKNDGEWTTFDSTVSLAQGDTLKVYNLSNKLSQDLSNYISFNMTGKISASGNVMSLLKYSSLYQLCFARLFINCRSLISPPEMPATTLATYCYFGTFFNTGITRIPELPATTLAQYSYSSMFQSCTALTEAEFSATTLANGSCNQMFQSCTNLNKVKVYFTQWTSGASTNWLNSVSASGTFIAPSGLPDTRGVNNIPQNWDLERI